MNKLFKDIRHSDIEAVRATISKNITVVNEVYNAKAPKRIWGNRYSCSEKYMNLIPILLENGANPNRKTSSEMLPIGTAVNQAEIILERKTLIQIYRRIWNRYCFDERNASYSERQRV